MSRRRKRAPTVWRSFSGSRDIQQKRYMYMCLRLRTWDNAPDENRAFTNRIRNQRTLSDVASGAGHFV